MKGNVGWQLYGSRKPGNEAYKLKHIFTTMIENDCIDITEVDIVFIDFNKYFPKFCVRNAKIVNQFNIKKKRNKNIWN